jgi:hypothetical protein
VTGATFSQQESNEMERSRRLRTYQIDTGDMVLFLNWAKRQPQYIAVPEMSGIPDGADVEWVYACPERRSIAVVVSHPSFPEVPDGEQIPFETGFMKMRSFAVPVKPMAN